MKNTIKLHKVQPLDKTDARTIKEFIGRKIRELRKRDRISQGRLAELLDVTFQQIQKYEQGLNNITVYKLWKVAIFFNMTLDEFMKEIKDILK